MERRAASSRATYRELRRYDGTKKEGSEKGDDDEDVEADDINRAGDDVVVVGKPVPAPVGAPPPPVPGLVAAPPAYSGMLANCRE